MWRSDPPDLAITGVLFLALLLVVWAGSWALDIIVGACLGLWCARRRRPAA